VYVAAQGPLWRSGGDRGLYKTIDGGRTWTRVLHASDDTGINEVHMDPRNPDVLYASAYQRRRHVWTLINGGPESALYKSTDAGGSWRKLTNGIPEVDMGRIGLDISPADPDVVYAIIEAAGDKGGVFRSLDRGETWERRSEYMTTSPQYYNEIICDPQDADRLYALDTFLNVTEDGGKTFKRMPIKDKHVDDHALWINPHNTRHLRIGCDGGLYETWDRGENWEFKPNLPITQFYRVAVDDSRPFYYVYGGTQDNNTLGGPSRTRSPAGIVNEDWFVTVGGDGFEPQIDPLDPNIVYSQWQHGGLVRFDRSSGEIVDIKPREAHGEEPYRWNWDSPLLISPHDPQRLYFAANRLLCSDDRGESWRPVSGNLSRGLDRNQLPVMGRIQSADAVAKNMSTSIYGNCVSLCESPRIEGLLYVGTDDGLVHVTADGGGNWQRLDSFPGVPELTYVSCLQASLHGDDTLYAAFDNHKNGDFTPYVLKSTDRGRSWTSIAGDLPKRDIVYTIAEDHVRPELLFAGTEFGVYFTIDGGQRWIQLKGGMPPIAVRDLAIQRRENDLVLATFGRGFYILDDYTPLRQVDDALLEEAVVLFPVKDALRYVETSRFGGPGGRGTSGASYYAAPNPPFGAVFTLYLKDKLITRKERRQEAEKLAVKEGRTAPYPTLEQLRTEDEEREPGTVLIVRDGDDRIVRRLDGPRDKGLHRVAWDLRDPASTPTSLEKEEPTAPWDTRSAGPLASPGRYTVTLASQVDGKLEVLAGPQPFEIVPLDLGTFQPADREAVVAFHRKVARLQRAVRGAIRSAEEAGTRVAHLRRALLDTPSADEKLLVELEEVQGRLNGLLTRLRADQTLRKRSEPEPASIDDRVGRLVGGLWYTTAPPTRTQLADYDHAADEFTLLLDELRTLVQKDLSEMERRLEELGAPWTPGRFPAWQRE
jgi:photosystem II stability/assembly factor-like uncharacterized protein